MGILGIVVVPAAGRPRLAGALVSGSVHDPVIEDSFLIKAPDGTPGEQAVDLARLLQAKLPGIAFDRAVIRTAGPAPVARRLKAQFSRAHAEGASLFVLREHTDTEVVVGDTRYLAKYAGLTKDELEAKASALSGGNQDALIAAIAGLPRE